MSEGTASYQEGEMIGGRYRVVRSILGGFGEVFLCKDVINQQPYALKTIKKEFINSKSKRARFRNEVECLLALGDHPNFVRCHWMEEIDSRPFMFLEWVGSDFSKRTNLSDWMRHATQDRRLALNIAIDICQGLQYANQQLPGFVHCDLKPRNILIGRNKVAKVSDLDLAILKKSSTQKPKANGRSFGGTPPYRSPEQWLGEGVDVRTDIYAIGCLLYELFSGKRLFKEVGDLGFARLDLEIPVPKLADRANLPLSVDTLLERCLAKQKNDRFPNIDELLNSLVHLYQNLFSELPSPKPAPLPFDAIDFTNRSYAYINLQKYDLALADCDWAIDLNPNLAQAYSNRGLVFISTGEYVRAISSLTQAIEADGSDPSFYANRAFAYLNIGSYTQAVSDYSHAIQRDMTNIQLRLSRAYSYCCLNRLNEALDEYNYALELDASNIEIYINRGSLHHRLKNFQEAIFDYTRVIEGNPRNAAIYHCRGLIYMHIEQFEESIADYNKALELDFENAALFCDRGLVHASLKNHHQSLMDYSQAIQLNPDYFQAYYNRGNVHEAMGLLEQALEDYYITIKINPNYGLAFLNIGKLLNKIGQKNESSFYFERAQQLGAIPIEDIETARSGKTKSISKYLD